MVSVFLTQGIKSPVSPDNTLMILCYALVAESPDHEFLSNPMFIIRAPFGSTAIATNNTCPNIDLPILADPGINGWHKNLNGNLFLYKDWDRIGFDGGTHRNLRPADEPRGHLPELRRRAHPPHDHRPLHHPRRLPRRQHLPRHHRLHQRPPLATSHHIPTRYLHKRSFLILFLYRFHIVLIYFSYTSYIGDIRSI